VTHRAGAVLYAVDPDRLVPFYERVCGLTRVDAPAELVVLVSDAWELHVVAVPAPIAARIELTSPPAPRTTTPIKLVFDVDDLAAARAAAAPTGGVVDAPAREWDFDGAVRCDGHDPEGNVVQLRALVVGAGTRS
jgi:predicted enzyme related to lactoylglutathione lyase